MKFCKPTFGVMAALGLWIMIALCGCDGKPARKKLPDFTNLQGWEDMPLTKTGNQSFFISDTTIMQGTKLANFLCVELPDPNFDSVAINMVISYEPLASTLLGQWKKQDKKGILIDLRSNSDNDYNRTDFIVKNGLPGEENINIPLLFIWDIQSKYRADYLMKLLISLPEIKCDLISDSHKAEGTGRNDCFSPVVPSFDQQ